MPNFEEYLLYGNVSLLINTSLLAYLSRVNISHIYNETTEEVLLDDYVKIGKELSEVGITKYIGILGGVTQHDVLLKNFSPSKIYLIDINPAQFLVLARYTRMTKLERIIEDFLSYFVDKRTIKDLSDKIRKIKNNTTPFLLEKIRNSTRTYLIISDILDVPGEYFENSVLYLSNLFDRLPGPDNAKKLVEKILEHKPYAILVTVFNPYLELYFTTYKKLLESNGYQCRTIIKYDIILYYCVARKA